MASYAYTAINAAGAELTGEISAPDLPAAREQLRLRGLLATELATQDSAAKSPGSGVKKVKAKSLQIFSRQFATMIEAGLNVVTALVILEEQTEDKKLASVISELLKRHNQGCCSEGQSHRYVNVSVSARFSEQPNDFAATSGKIDP